MPNWAFHAHFSPFSNGSCQIGPLMPSMAHYGGLWFYSKDLLLVWGVLRVFLYTSVSLSPIDKRNQANNPRKRNSPLNTCVEDIRVEVPLKPFEELDYYLLHVNRFLILFLSVLFWVWPCISCIHVMHNFNAWFYSHRSITHFGVGPCWFRSIV